MFCRQNGAPHPHVVMWRTKEVSGARQPFRNDKAETKESLLRRNLLQANMF